MKALFSALDDNKITWQDMLPEDSVFIFSHKTLTNHSLMYSENANCIFVIIYRWPLFPCFKKCKTALQDSQVHLVLLIPYSLKVLKKTFIKQMPQQKNLKCFFYKVSKAAKIEIIDVKTYHFHQSAIYKTKPLRVNLKKFIINECNERIFENESSFRLIRSPEFRKHAESNAIISKTSAKDLLKKQTIKTLCAFLYYKIIQKLEG